MARTRVWQLATHVWHPKAQTLPLSLMPHHPWQSSRNGNSLLPIGQRLTSPERHLAQTFHPNSGARLNCSFHLPPCDFLSCCQASPLPPDEKSAILDEPI
eukprot:Gregarina_sp_Pseudo_9__1040@NODE_1674_length_1408_cov_1424_097882_g837_i3_p1_GENE_NODE_1674_length_1408_cov_1424_097882_g837_i3NODE_1674_length_1408_cov_1424_097882_g837_i3_p1_ORF_typecomplete_len100_score1_13FixO/PF02433_15/4_9FixO/PF02433_15/4_7_NODE_1674_length_1408_cov_1424_097882_g837_i3533832